MYNLVKLGERMMRQKACALLRLKKVTKNIAKDFQTIPFYKGAVIK